MAQLENEKITEPKPKKSKDELQKELEANFWRLANPIIGKNEIVRKHMVRLAGIARTISMAYPTLDWKYNEEAEPDLIMIHAQHIPDSDKGIAIFVDSEMTAEEIVELIRKVTGITPEK